MLINFVEISHVILIVFIHTRICIVGTIPPYSVIFLLFYILGMGSLVHDIHRLNQGFWPCQSKKEFFRSSHMPYMQQWLPLPDWIVQPQQKMYPSIKLERVSSVFYDLSIYVSLSSEWYNFITNFGCKDANDESPQITQ